jgi:hypothetical protein
MRGVWVGSGPALSSVEFGEGVTEGHSRLSWCQMSRRGTGQVDDYVLVEKWARAGLGGTLRVKSRISQRGRF